MNIAKNRLVKAAFLSLGIHAAMLGRSWNSSRSLINRGMPHRDSQAQPEASALKAALPPPNIEQKPVTTDELVKLIDRINPPKPPLAEKDNAPEEQGNNQPATIASALAKDTPNKASGGLAASAPNLPGEAPINQDKSATAPVAMANPLTPAQRAEAQKQFDLLAETGRALVNNYFAEHRDPGHWQPKGVDFLSFVFSMHYWHQRTQDKVYLLPDNNATLENLRQEIESWAKQYEPIARSTTLPLDKKLETLVALIHSKSVYDPDAFYLPSAIREVVINGKKITVNAGGQQCMTRAILGIGILAHFPEMLGEENQLFAAKYGTANGGDDHDDVAIVNPQKGVFLLNYGEWQSPSTVRANLVVPLYYISGLSFSARTEKNRNNEKLIVSRSPVVQTDNSPKTVTDGPRMPGPDMGSGISSHNTFYQGEKVSLKREKGLSPASKMRPGERNVFHASAGSLESSSSAIDDPFSLEKQKAILDLSADIANLMAKLQIPANNNLQAQRALLVKVKELAVSNSQVLFNPSRLTNNQVNSLLEIMAKDLTYYRRLYDGNEQQAQRLVDLGLAEKLDHGLILIKGNAKQLLDRNTALAGDEMTRLSSIIDNAAGQSVNSDLSRLSYVFSLNFAQIQTEIDQQIDSKNTAAKTLQGEIAAAATGNLNEQASQELLKKIKELIAVNSGFNLWRDIGQYNASARIPAITLTQDEFLAIARKTIEGANYYKRLYTGTHSARLVALGLAEQLKPGLVLLKEDARNRLRQVTVSYPDERKELSKIIREAEENAADKVRDDIFRLAWYARMDYSLAYKTIYGRLRTSFARELSALAPANAPADTEADYNKQHALLARSRWISVLFPAGKDESAFARQRTLMAETKWVRVEEPNEPPPAPEEQISEKQFQTILLNYLRYYNDAPATASVQSLPGELVALADLAHSSLQQGLTAVLANYQEITFKPVAAQPSSQVPPVISLPANSQSSWTWIDIEVIPMPALPSPTEADHKTDDQRLQVTLSGFANFVLAIPWNGDPAINFPAIRPILLKLTGEIKGDSIGLLAQELRKQH